MEILRGISTFPGIAIGTLCIYYRNQRRFQENLTDDVQEELELFQKVLDKGRRELEELAAGNSEEEAQNYKLQRELLESPSFQNAVTSMISLEKVTVCNALDVTGEELASNFASLETPKIRNRIQNLKHLTRRLRAIGESLIKRSSLVDAPFILAADSLLPKDVAELPKKNLCGVVTREGSSVAHASIMTKNLAIPALVDIRVSPEWDRAEAIIDGYTGALYLEPDQETRRFYEERRKSEQEEERQLLSLRDAKDVTLDGKEIHLTANIGGPGDIDNVKFYGASGIGLLRSEFQYLERDTYPREQELFLAYKEIAEAMGSKKVVIRTVDLGADNRAAYMELPRETNPMMGNRGIRLCLERRYMFRAQLRAIYRASAYGKLAVLFPMITSVEEIREAKKMAAAVVDDLRRKEIPFDEEMPMGILIETPAAALISGQLAREVDFLSLGTNDLIQYTLAMDRQNPALEGKCDDHHPAVIKLIHMVIEEGHRAGVAVNICGEMAADTTLTEKFLRMGVDGLSVVPACILPVRKRIREIRLDNGCEEAYGRTDEGNTGSL